jgi:Na+/H+-dicarboxylate symporter
MPFLKVLSVILSSVVLVMAMPGIPGMAIVCLSSVLTMSGCPLDVLGLVIGIDPIIDMIATVGGVTGALLAVMIVAKSEKLINKELL